MIKVLFLLSTLIMLMAGFFSYKNRDTFIKTRLERQEKVRETNKELLKLKGMANEVVEVRGKVAAVQADLTTEQERLQQAKIKKRNADVEADRIQSELEKVQGKIADYRKELDAIPKGINLETIQEDINKLKQDTVLAEGEVEKVQETVAAKEADLKKTEAQLADIQERIETRKKSFDRNSLTATVVAVNNDWGFVVIDGGENKNITPETKLLVVRGNQTIGKLNIVSVDKARTVANIDPESLRSGLSIAPGDRVILETLFQ